MRFISTLLSLFLVSCSSLSKMDERVFGKTITAFNLAEDQCRNLFRKGEDLVSNQKCFSTLSQKKLKLEISSIKTTSMGGALVFGKVPSKNHSISCSLEKKSKTKLLKNPNYLRVGNIITFRGKFTSYRPFGRVKSFGFNKCQIKPSS